MNKPKPKRMPLVRRYEKIGRNEVCPCGSGKKYKLCHLVLADDAARERLQRSRDEA